MTVEEIAHRVAEAVKRRTWKGDLRGWSAFPARGELCFSAAMLQRMQRPVDPALLETIIASNCDFRDGKISLLGRDWPLSPADQGIPWLVDPLTGGKWPGAEAYCFSVNHRNQHDLGDVKYVWEINRLQFLPGLALEERTMPLGQPSLVFALLRSWMDENPPFRGINWSSGIELALRIVAVVFASAILADRMTADQRALVLQFISAHAFWVHRFPSRFSSANNHRVSEGLAMMIAGLVAPDLPGAAAWLREGREVMEVEVENQFLADGVGAEQSPTYASFSAEMMVVALVFAEDYGKPLAPRVAARLEKTAGWLQVMLDDSGFADRIGDDDEGRVIAQFGVREQRYPASVLAALALALRRPHLAPPVHDAHIRDYLLGMDGAAAGRATDGLHVYKHGGISVYRGMIGGRKALATLDHGPLGFLSIAAHGHADALSLLLRLDGHPILADAGTYLYHSKREWRDAFRSTALHNTLMLAGTDQSRIAGSFMWSHRANATLRQAVSDPQCRLVAEHDGYLKEFGLTHVREVDILADQIVVTDRLEGDRPSPQSTIGWLFHPDVELQAQQGGFVASRKGVPVLRLEIPANFSAEIVRGDEERHLGWYSSAFGSREPAFQLVVSGIVSAEPAITRITVL